MKKDKLRYITLVARLIVGIVLIYAALSKIPNAFYFSIQIENYRIVGRGIARMVAVTLPWIELITGLCLIAGWWLRPASFIANGLFLLFIVGIISALVR
ncbi:DoxX family membrane protein, partial [Candidatus Sumerlaeota bacterium]|nr:DoxX family membrane protein [Candidatus Sumerlaeota bacterium]